MAKVFYPILFLIFSGTALWAAPQGEKLYDEKIEPVFVKFCYDCHGDGMDKGDFAMDDFDSVADHLKDLDVWFEIWKNMRASLMPPPDKKQMTDAEKHEVLRYIEDHVFKIDRDNPDPGRVTIRRLNREEYQHTIKDALKVEFRAHDFFPPDDTGYGFDTIGDVLSISPLLMEKYLDAAKYIAAKAVPVDGPQIVEWWVDPKTFKGLQHESHHIGYMPFESNRRFEAKRWINYDAEYEFKITYKISGSKEATEETGTLTFGYDDKTIITKKVAWNNSRELVVKGKGHFKKGDGHKFFLEMKPGAAREKGEDKLYVRIESIRYRGPLDGSKKDYPWEFREIFSEGPPPEEAERDPYREKILRRLALKLFRRPPTDEMIDRLVKLARTKDEEEGYFFEHGIRHAVTAMLVSPHFLMRSELQPDPNDPDRIQLLDEYSLASRLSYFLWLSAPDEELMKLAGEGKLREQLRPQINRMLADKKSQRFIESFVGQWLQARDVETIHIEARAATGTRDLGEARRLFSTRLRQAMRKETEMFFHYILTENRPASELLTAKYAFLNEELANWYDIKGVEGRDMRKVELKDRDARERGGLLKQATFQIVTSNPTRTSPVKRGLFVLENLLAIPPPPAAPDVPPLEQSISGKNKNISLREALALHSEEKMCASCHARMDPIGLAMENYNFAGMWIDTYKGKPLDTAGKLVSGETFKNADELSTILATEKQEQFFTAVTEKLFTFALGRGVEFFDAPTIDGIVEQARTDGGRLIDILYGVIESPAFQKRRGDGSLLR